MARLLLAAVFVLGAMAPSADLYATGGTSASAHALSFRLTDSNGAVHTERELAGAHAAVLFFIMPDCPVSQGYVPEMNRIADGYAARGIVFFAVQADLTASLSTVRAHVAEYGYHFPVLIDPGQLLVRHTGATTTPEAIVITSTGSVRYQGRIDNRIARLGVNRPQATELDLRDALDALLAGRSIVNPRTTAYGCLIARTS